MLLVTNAALISRPAWKARYRLAMAAPASDGSSLDDPAEGYVSDTVEVSEEGSVTTVRPVDFRVVMEGERGVAGDGVETGMLLFWIY